MIQLLPDWKHVAKTSWSFRLGSFAISLGMLWQGADAMFDYPPVVGEWIGRIVLGLGVLALVARVLLQPESLTPEEPKDDPN